MTTRSLIVGLCSLTWVACAAEAVDVEPRARPEPAPSTQEETSPPVAGEDADLLYLVHPQTGRIARDVPPALLAEVLRALEARGLSDELRQMKQLYDPASGRARDPVRLKRAELRLAALGLMEEARHAARQ